MSSQSIHLLYGQNILNTLQSEIAYTYNQNEGSINGLPGYFGGSYLQPVWYQPELARSGILTKDTTLHWNELVGHAGLQLPLNFSGGKQYRYLTLSSTYNVERINWTGLAAKFCPTGIFFSHAFYPMQQIKKQAAYLSALGTEPVIAT